VRTELVENLFIKDPFDKLKEWMKQATQNSEIKEPTAMVLSTVQGVQPDSRVVLAKEICKDGIIFYTNIFSQKGQQLHQNPHCSLLFYWDSLFRQIRMQGKVSLVSRQKTLEYWKTRSKESQMSQWVSKQSHFLENRNCLELLVQKAQKEFEGKPVPCPENWSGYFVFIESFEFWQGRDHRLHDRVVCNQNKDGSWSSQRLYP